MNVKVTPSGCQIVSSGFYLHLHEFARDAGSGMSELLDFEAVEYC